MFDLGVKKQKQKLASLMPPETQLKLYSSTQLGPAFVVDPMFVVVTAAR
jgi:hypothetical protein